MKKIMVVFAMVMAVVFGMAMGPAEALAKEPKTSSEAEIMANMAELEELTLPLINNSGEFLVVSSHYYMTNDELVVWTVKGYNTETREIVEDQVVLNSEEIQANSTYFRLKRALEVF